MVSNHRANQQTNQNATANGPGETPATQTGASAAPPYEGSTQSQGSAQAGRATQPTATAPSDPITYQVEIETRMPIAFALENALLNGLVNNGGGLGGMTPPQQVDDQNQQPNQPGHQNSDGASAGTQDPAGQGQANRRQVLLGKIIILHIVSHVHSDLLQSQYEIIAS